MPRTKTLTNLYDQLKPAERIRLCMEAAARGDRAERNRLIGACPKVIYRQRDAAFDNGLEAAQFLALTMYLDLRPDVHMFRQLYLFSERIKRYREQTAPGIQENEASGNQATPTSESESTSWPVTDDDMTEYGYEVAMVIGESMLDLMDRLTKMRVNIRTTWTAWEEFCQETWQMDGITVVRANLGELIGEIEFALKHCADVEPDTKEVQEYKKTLRELLAIKGGA